MKTRRPTSRRFHVLLALAALALLWIARQAAPPDEARLVQAAVDYSYPSIYLDLAALRQDYPGFTPRVRRWSDNVLFLVGERLKVRIVGHCFWACKSSSEPLVLTIAEPGRNSVQIDRVDGRVLVAVQLSKEGSYFASTRLSKAAFEQARDCAPAVRERWPNIGGAAWRR
jgi:hypothetical protein